MKKTIKIIQHTPVIHHRPDEKGVLFSKQRFISALDRFIIKKMEESNLNLPPIWKSYGYFQDTPDNKSLNYRLDIKLGEQIIPRDIRSPLYFGNLGDGVKKAFTYSNREIELIFDRADEGLLKCIEKHIAEFLLKTTIGNRGSKGFGSFYIKTDKVFESISEILKNHYYLEFKFSDSERDSVQDYIQNCINYYHKRLKSGINFRSIDPQYRRAFLPKYLGQLTPQKYFWEKRWLKKEGILIHRYKKNEKNESQEPDYYPDEINNATPIFARPMLGLPENFTFNLAPFSTRIEIQNTQTISVKNDDIERVPSPIIFKPIIEGNKVRIYLIIDDTLIKQVFDKEFQFIPSIELIHGIKIKEKKDRNNQIEKITFEFTTKKILLYDIEFSQDIIDTAINFSESLGDDNFDEFVRRNVPARLNINVYLDKYNEGIRKFRNMKPCLTKQKNNFEKFKNLQKNSANDFKLKTPSEFDIDDLINKFNQAELHNLFKFYSPSEIPTEIKKNANPTP